MIERSIYNQLEKVIGKNKVVVLLGARRVGKTSLLKQLEEKHKKRSLYLNGEDLQTQELLAEQKASAYKTWLDKSTLLLLDEAQAIPNIGKHLKLLIDSFPKLTIIATGSSAFDLSNKLGEPLVGRLVVVHLFPIAQLELNTLEKPIERIHNLEKRLLFGGYPEIVLSDDSEEKKEYLKNIVSGYLLRDILAFENIKNPIKLQQLLQLIAYQLGNEVSYDELAKHLQIDRNTVVRYLDLLSKVFVVFRLGSFSNNLRKEITKGSKWYFYDVGIRNALINNFSPLALRQDVGALWENYLISERFKKNSYTKKHINSYFWRTYDQQEIDYIELQDGKMQAFEFKWKKEKNKVPIFFSKSYPKTTVLFINKDNYRAFISD